MHRPAHSSEAHLTSAAPLRPADHGGTPRARPEPGRLPPGRRAALARGENPAELGFLLLARQRPSPLWSCRNLGAGSSAPGRVQGLEAGAAQALGVEVSGVTPPEALPRAAEAELEPGAAWAERGAPAVSLCGGVGPAPGPRGASLGTPTSGGCGGALRVRGRPRRNQIPAPCSLAAEPAPPSLRSLLVMRRVWRSGTRKELVPVPRATWFFFCNFVNPNCTFERKLSVLSSFSTHDS